MALKQIGDLPRAASVDDESLFPAEQQGAAVSVSGAQFKGYAVDSVSPYATQAANSASEAAQSASQAAQSLSQIGDSVTQAQQSATAAQEAAEAAEAAKEGIDEAAQQAAASAQAAADSASQASASATSASSNAGTAEDAKTAAQAAQTAAENAKSSAETASASALQSAQSASKSADTANSAASAASGSADAAAASAAAAQAAQASIENLTVEAETLPTGEEATVQKSLVDGIVNLLFGLPTGATGEQGIPGNSIQSITRTSGTGAPGTTDTYTVTLTDGNIGGTFEVYNGANGTGTGDFMADGSVPMTGNLQMGGNRITNVGEPTADTDAATKGYVDGGFVPDTRTVNGQALSADVTLGAGDIAFADGQTFQQKYDSGELTGPPGADGAQGEPGPAGADGAAATIAVGTVTTGEPGTSASVTNSGTSSAAVFDFTIPQGPQGEPGPGAIAFTVALPVASWSGNQQTVTDERIIADGYSYIVSALPDDYLAYGSAMVWADDVTQDGEIVFNCSETPTTALSANIVRIEV